MVGSGHVKREHDDTILYGKKRRQKRKRSQYVPPPPVSCPFEIYGCRVVASPKEITNHQKLCRFRPADLAAHGLWKDLLEFYDNAEGLATAHGFEGKSLKKIMGNGARLLRTVTDCEPGDQIWLTPEKEVRPPFYDQLLCSIPPRSFVQRKLKGHSEDLDTAILHLAQPNPVHQVYKLSVPSPQLERTFPLVLPPYIRDPDEQNWNVTGRYKYTGIHIDRGLGTYCYQSANDDGDDGASGGRKIWLLWPPSSAFSVRFFELWAAFMSGELDDGILPHLHLHRCPTWIAETKPGYALVVPPGWFHAVWTLESGFLGGASWVVPETRYVWAEQMKREMEAVRRSALLQSLVDSSSVTRRAELLRAPLLKDVRETVHGFVIFLGKFSKDCNAMDREFVATFVDWVEPLDELWMLEETRSALAVLRVSDNSHTLRTVGTKRTRGLRGG